MGVLQYKQGEMDDALAGLLEALRIRRQHEDPVKFFETLKYIGDAHCVKGEYELAVECYEECMDVAKSELGKGGEEVSDDALAAIENVSIDTPEEAKDATDCYQKGKKKWFDSDSFPLFLSIY